MKKLVIYGAWNFSQVVAEAATASGWQVLGHVDPDPPKQVATLGNFPGAAAVVVAIGDNSAREAVTSVLAEHGRNIVTIVHPNACISPSASIGRGCYIAEMAVVRTNATLGRGVILQTGSIVSHDSQVQSFASFGPHAATAGGVQIGRRTMVGTGSSIAPGVCIGNDCTVAVGAAVFRNSEEKKTLIGNPAKATSSPYKELKQSNWQSNTVW